jgi:alpha-L-rhamnosidase
MYGVAESRWQIRQRYFCLDVTIPPNTTATVQLPGTIRIQKIGSGHYRFRVPWRN